MGGSSYTDNPAKRLILTSVDPLSILGKNAGAILNNFSMQLKMVRSNVKNLLLVEWRCSSYTMLATFESNYLLFDMVILPTVNGICQCNVVSHKQI